MRESCRDHPPHVRKARHRWRHVPEFAALSWPLAHFQALGDVIG
jgi:hypothetical protein